jgi:hypothetical protein
MSMSPLSPEEIRAAAEVYRELGPEYSDAVVASFLEKVDREIAARVDARLAGAHQAQPTQPDSRRTLVKGMVIGACAALIAASGVGLAGAAVAAHAHSAVVHQVPNGPVKHGPPGAVAPPKIPAPPGG